MPEAALDITSTDTFPVFATKAAFMTALQHAIDQYGSNRDIFFELLYRLSNTDTDNWTAGSTARHDD